MPTKKPAKATGTTVKKNNKGETGHAKNVSNFEKLYSECKMLGTRYNPSQNYLSLGSLAAMQTAGEKAIGDVADRETAQAAAVHERANNFADLKPFCTRVVGAFNTCKPPDNVKENASSILKIIRGVRITPIAEAPPAPTDGTEPLPTPTTISATHQSYNSLVLSFGDLIKLLITHPEYNPNETDLQVPSLQAKLGLLKASNSAVINADAAIGNARIVRDQLLYAKDTGLVDIAFAVKDYVMSAFNATAPEYKRINKIPFKTLA